MFVLLLLGYAIADGNTVAPCFVEANEGITRFVDRLRPFFGCDATVITECFERG